MATEKVQFEVGLGTRQFDTGMTKMRSQMSALSGPSGKMSESLGKAATATSGLAGAMGGATGKAGALVGAADNLTQAFMIGGPLALGMAGIATGAALLINRWQDGKKAAVDFENALRDQARSGLKEYEDQLRGIRTEIENLGKSQFQIQMEENEFVVQAATVALGTYNIELAENEARLAKIAQFQAAGINMYDKEAARLTRRNRELRANVEREKGLIATGLDTIDAIEERTRKTDALEKTERRLVRTRSDAQALDPFFDQFINGTSDTSTRDAIRKNYETGLEVAREADREREALRLADVASATEAERLKAEAARLAIEDTLARERAAAEERQAIHASVSASIQGMGQDTFASIASSAIASTQMLFEGIAAGEEHAAEKAGVALLRSVGNQLVGIGTRAVIEGAIISANPLTPGAGLPMVGLGTLAIATGIGMGAAGAAASANLAPSGGASGGGVASSPRMGGSGMEGTGRRSSSSVNAEPVTVTYVFNAPVVGDPNQTARFIAQNQRRAETQLLEGRRR